MQDRIPLELRNVGHVFGDIVAVDDLCIDIKAGEVVCLLGPSGCGKTTALRIAAGLETLQHGEVFTGGNCVAGNGVNVPPEKRGIGLVFQDYALFPHLTVLQNVAFGLGHLSASEKSVLAAAALEKVDMKWATARYPHTLSGGQQQRVALARAMVPEPPVILFDEPFSGLDARLRDQVRDETLHILKETGTAALLVTHDSEEAMFMADRIAVMRKGRIIQFDNPDILYTHPVDVFVAEFFGDVNKFFGIAVDGMVITSVGKFPAPMLEDGDEAEVIIRPEAVRISVDQSDLGFCGKVVASRMLGRTSLIHLCHCNLAKEEFHLHSLVPGRFLPKDDENVFISLNPDDAFVFAASRSN